MKRFRIAASLMLLITISLVACGAETSPPVATPPPTPTTPAATATAVSLFTEPTSTPAETATPVSTFTSTSTPSPQPTATNTLVPTVTPPPSSTPEPPEPEPVVKVDESLTSRINVRAGPGTNYPVVTQLEPGQEAPVIGRNGDDSWWQIDLISAAEGSEAVGWVYGELVILNGDDGAIPIAEAPPPPPTPEAVAEAEAEAEAQAETEGDDNDDDDEPSSPEELAEQLRCGNNFCVTYQAMVPIWENAGCVGNHSIYITVLEGLPPGKPLDGVVIGDTFNNVEVASGSHGPGRTEITLWMNSMTLVAKRHIDGTPYTSEESFNFTAHDELIPADVLAAAGYCDGSIEKCREAQQHNQICRGHYSWRVTFHKFD